MTNPTRNSFIISHAFRRFFVASVLTAIIAQLNMLVDGVIVGHMVGVDAISAINISFPILSMVMLVSSMIGVGASLIMAGEIGNQNQKQVDRLFTMGLSSIFFVTLVLVIALSSYTNAISRLLTDEERLLPLLNSYLPISLIGCLVFALQFAFAQFVKISGQPGLVTKCMIVASLGNIAFDLLFVVVFDMGMQGAALASMANCLLSMLVFIPYLRSEHKPFKFVRISWGWYGALLGRSLVRGLPVAVGVITLATLVMCLNAIVLESQGANGLFIFSVCMQMLMIVLFIMEGAGNAITGIGGLLLGEQDHQGVHLLTSKIFRIITMAMVVFSAVVIMFPSLLAGLFGASGELLLLSEGPLRIFSFIFIPIGLVIPLSDLFMTLNRNVMASMINVGILVCMLPLVWMAAYFTPEYFWYSIPVSMWLLLLVTAMATWIASRRSKELHWFFLTQTTSQRHWVTYSVQYESEDVGKKLNELLDFIALCKLSQKLSLNIHHCLEELMYNEMEMAHFTKKEGTFDISVNNQEDKVSIIIKDVGKPYNPTIKYIPDNIDDIDQSHLSMILVGGLCENINYKYMNGINCLYLTFNK